MGKNPEDQKPSERLETARENRSAGSIRILCNHSTEQGSHEDSDPKLQYLGEQTYLSIRSPLESDIEKSIAGGLIKTIDPKLPQHFSWGPWRV